MVQKYEVALLDGRPVTIRDPEHILREASREGKLTCPANECGHAQLVYKHGPIRDVHFSHLGETYNHTGESAEHFTTKVGIRDRILHDNSCLADVEFYTKPRRPDVYIETLSPERKKIAIEIQRSDIPADELVRKIEEYTKQDIYTLYLFDSTGGAFGRRATPDGRRRFLSFAEQFILDYTDTVHYVTPDVHTNGELKERRFHPRVFCTKYYSTPLGNTWGFTDWKEINNLELRLFEREDLKFAEFATSIGNEHRDD